jgi:hypothetical protein
MHGQLFLFYRHRRHMRARECCRSDVFELRELNKRWRDLPYVMQSVECKLSLMIKIMPPFFSFDNFQKMV